MEFQVLGPVRLHAGGLAISVGEPRQQTVLAVLLLDAGRTVGVDTLVDRVWGDDPPQQVRRSLHAHITRIRRALEQAGCTSLTRDAGGYRIDTDEVDLFRFRRMQGGDRAELRAALDLWRGEPLAGLKGDWAERTRRALEQEHTAAVVAWADKEIDAGAAASTIVRLTQLADEQPLQETVAATLMRALYTVGRATDALAHYERVRHALRDDLGADPGPDLAAVYQAVLRHDVEPTPPPPGAPKAPAQLPGDVAAFTGRADELAALDEHADDVGREPVIVCLTGTAGAGKTATAVHWGHRVRDRFPDGQLYLDLRGYAPDQPLLPADALVTLLTALLPAGTEIPLGLDERAARFRTEVAGRRMLVVLDNAATVDQVRPLLPGTNTCLVVVTSRDSLAGLVALHGAHRIAVGQLPAADAIALLRRLIGPRVDAEPTPAAGLADRCVHLPLTLRLAAELAVSRPTTPLAKLVDELSAGLDALSGGADQRAAVRAVFSWSLRQLSDEATRAFAVLGRHPAPTFDAYVLAALAGGGLDCARTVLDTLVRAHLVQPVDQDRYGMHDLLKAYAAETGGGEDAAVDRVYAYYLATAAAAMDRLYPGEAHRRPPVAPPPGPMPDLHDAEAAREWLAAEMSTVESLAAHADPRHAIALSAVLFRYLDGQANPVAVAIHGHARDAAHAVGDRAAQANARNALGGAHMSAGRPDAAMVEMLAALDLFTEVGDGLGQARAHGNIGMIEERAGRYRRAVGHYGDALTRYRAISDVTGPAHVLTRLGTVEVRLGRVTAGQDHLREALALHRMAGHRFGEAWVKIGLGEVAAAQGDLDSALARHDEAVSLFKLFGHTDSEAWAIDGLGRTETQRGNPFVAATHHSQALELFRRYGDRDGEAWSLNGLGEACHAGGSVAAATVNHGEALAVASRTGAHDQAARAHRGLARAAPDADTAARHHEEALRIHTDLGLPTDGMVVEAARHRE